MWTKNTRRWSPVAPRIVVRRLMAAGAVAVCLPLTAATPYAIDLPVHFEENVVFTGLDEPSNLEFAPDGRMFICERVTGRLRVATWNESNDTWDLSPVPFYTFDVPKDGAGEPSALRSAGLRDIAFDPDFTTNGFVYAFYMKHGALQNRVVRIETSAEDPDLAAPSSEVLLFELPFTDTTASGSHNGGSLVFGPHGMLYVATGDGWNGGDPVQSLATNTGKIFRVAPSGGIPVENPFFDTADGDQRGIFALGLRNPFSMSRDPSTGSIYVNDARGASKASVYLVRSGANYGHQGFGGIGQEETVWANGGDAAGRVITGGTWYPLDGTWPAEYRGRYFVTMWGPNDSTAGHINFIDASDATAYTFASQVGSIDDSNGNTLKPATPEIGPDSNLYYLTTTYTTNDGAVHRIRYTGPAVDAGPRPRPIQISSYPNPFNPSTTISYTIPRGGMVRVTIHDAAGRLLQTLLDERRPGGTAELSYRPIETASGVKYVRLWFEGVEATRKLIALK